MIPNKDKMEYRYLGNTGMKVSVLGLGNFVNAGEDITLQTVKLALENGVNYFDTAEIYDLGKAETSLGKAFKELKVPREKVVVSTKVFRIGTDPNDTFQSRKHIIEGVTNSLKRLQLDYVDVAFAHRYDMHTPLEETVRAYNYLIEKGLCFYWGTSEWTACQVMDTYRICERLNLIPPIVEQCQYNMMIREKMENEYRDLFKKYKMGTTIWSPLQAGVLTGKYINDNPTDARLSSTNYSAANKKLYFDNKEEVDNKLLKLKEIAENKLSCSLTQLAIAWTIVNPDVSVCLLGASKVSQLEETLKSLEVSKKLTPEILLEIEEVLKNAPEGETDFRTWKMLPSRRNLLLGVKYPPEKKE